MEQYPKSLKIYVALLTIFSCVLGVYLIMNYDINYIGMLFFFSILSIIVESLLIPLPKGQAVSVGFGISLASIILGGPLVAYIVNGVGALFRVVKDSKRGTEYLFNRSIFKTFFNVSLYCITAGMSGIVYVKMGGRIGKISINFSLIPVFSLMVTYLIINTFLLSQLMSILTKNKLLNIWIDNIKTIVPSLLAIGTLGIIISLAYINYGPGAVLLFLGPLLLARYSFKLYMDMRRAYMDTILALTKTMEAKDPYTSGHEARVEEYSVKLAKALGVHEKKIENIKTAAVLHDIGKIGIDDSILRKPSALTEIEYKEIQKHPIIGAEILRDIDFLREISEIIKYHHERYDGQGYPEGKKGDEIPLESSILAIADVFDAMTSDRPYRNALTVKQAINEIKSNAGTQFDPEVANAFIEIINDEIERGVLLNAN